MCFKQIEDPKSILRDYHSYLPTIMEVNSRTERDVWVALHLKNGTLLEELERVTDNWVFDHVF